MALSVLPRLAAARPALALICVAAVVTGIQLDNDDGVPAAHLWYTAYFRTNGAAPQERPLVFSYNGGPGSASFWLHMGIMGPRRVVTPDVGPQGAPPYPLEDNAWTRASPARRGMRWRPGLPTIRSPRRSARPTRRRSTATCGASSATTATASMFRAAPSATGTGAG